MAHINFVGNVMADPELKTGTSGRTYCKFTVVENKRQPESKPNFWNCTAFGQSAELIANYVKKGRKLYICGKVDQRTYQSQAGERLAIDVVVDDWDLVDPKPKDEKADKAEADYDPYAGD